jgi:hypothetical protein
VSGASWAVDTVAATAMDITILVTRVFMNLIVIAQRRPAT